VPDASGILSLAGFSFQIKVFCCYASKLEEHKQIEFESLDDIATKKSAKVQNFDNTINGQIKTPSYQSIQVKHTTLTDSLAENVLMNWLQIENSSYDIQKYILVTDKKYGNTDLIKSIDLDSFIKEVRNSNKRKNANITKVKEIFANKSDQECKDLINAVLGKYEFQEIDIKLELEDCFKNIFLKSANQVLFEQRLEEFLSRITVEILKSVNLTHPYILSYEEFQKIQNDIIPRFTVNESLPSYSNFKRVHDVDLKDSAIAQSREYKQLVHCKLPDNIIKKHLIHEQYYRKARNNYIDIGLETKCEDVEETAFDNFEFAKNALQNKNIDTPRNRLDNTIQAENSYADTTQIREGVCIFLTAESTNDKKKISWKDE
jgi:hypothetical protein